MLVNQGLVSGSNFSELPTDDPSTADTDDPTMVPIDDDAIGILTLSGWALALLALLLAGVAVRFLVR